MTAASAGSSFDESVGVPAVRACPSGRCAHAHVLCTREYSFKFVCLCLSIYLYFSFSNNFIFRYNLLACLPSNFNFVNHYG